MDDTTPAAAGPVPRASAMADAVRALADGPAGILAVGEDGTIKAATEVAATTLGWPAATLIGQRLADLTGPHYADDVAAVLTGTQTGGSGRRVGAIAEDGLPRTIYLRGRAPLVELRLSGPILYWTSDPTEPVFRDSELRGVDSALSHDIRGALRSVKSFLELVERSDALDGDEKATRFLGIARNAGGEADTMTEQLVHLLRVRDRPVPIEAASVDNLLRQAVAHAAEGEDAAALELVTDDELPAVVGNVPLLVECFTELLTNARRFADAPTVGVEVRATVEDGWVTLRISDDGPGVPPDLAEDAFRLFRLLQPKGRFPGVGMGLPIVRAIAEVHGGTAAFDVDALRDPDQTGTTAVLRLVAAPAALTTER